MGIYDYDIISNVICFLSGLGKLQKLMLSNLIFHIKIAIWEEITHFQMHITHPCWN